MAILPIADPIAHSLNNMTIESENRYYLGISQIGDSCHRRLQYYHYWASKPNHSNRIQRIFDFGHLIEQNVREDLGKIGFEVFTSDVEIVGAGGHWRGHIDGLTYKDGHQVLVEIKTHNEKSFKDVKKNGVKKSKPGHYGQVQGYMGHLDIEECLYIAYNKNDSEYYVEFIPFDNEYFSELKRKENEIIMSDVLLPRIGNDSPAWFECKQCGVRDTCFKTKPPQANCRTCKNVDVLSDGEWRCNKHEQNLSTFQQRKGCSDFELGDMFK